MISSPAVFHTIADRLLDAVSDALAVLPGGAPERACVVPGQIAWDECECGLLAVAVRRMFLTDDFPNQPAAPSPCAAAFIGADLVVQVLRCAPQPEGQSLAPTCDALDASALQVIRDAHATLNTVACTLAEMESDNEIVGYMVLAQNAAGPAGQCVGSELVVQVAVNR